jgi:uncharacterized protein YcfJ
MKKFASVALSLALATTMVAATASEGFARSRKAECRYYAKRQADRVVNRDVGTGLALGAGGGMLLGGLTNGNKGLLPGLAIGAVGGTVVGAISGSEKRKRVYRAAYYDCMNNY